MVRRRDSVKDDDRLRDQGVAELHAGRTTSMNMQELDVLGQIGLHGRPVVHVEAFLNYPPLSLDIEHVPIPNWSKSPRRKRMMVAIF
jgi:hypothetical protein